MKLCIVLTVCIIMVASVYGDEVPYWTGQKCGVESNKLYDRQLGYDTCTDYCKGSNENPKLLSGRCEINNGYGECKCVVTYPMPPF